MGKPAARALIDKGAHLGLIQTGSPNVIIGGFPAARKTDGLLCKKHGQGIIVGGSGTVFVNGLPLARLGDQTQCNKAAAPKDKTAPPKYWGATVAKKAGPDGVIHGDNYDARALGAYASLEDKSGTGRFDTATIGFALQDLVIGNMKSQSLIRGEMRTKIAAANASGTLYVTEKDMATGSANATATGVQYGATGAVGKEGGLYMSAGGDFTFGTAEAKVISEVYRGGKGKYGFSTEIGAEAAAVKGEITTKSDILGVLTTEGKIGGSLGSVGASAGMALLVDETDYSLNVKASGELALALGIKGDVNIKFALKPLYDKWIDFHIHLIKLGAEFIYGDQKNKNVATKSVSGDGIIISGCGTVLVGD
ncbi:PAAR domain-containing protein [Cronobacter sakazakii]|uniref:PAAR domain-containing protein n=1 Tax=Cronobacter sakazakii TaxID=28141 RepID=UPI000CFD77F1|nr:PAAR domain-containing protein [Cronobacter sakazakii]EIZ9496370.1 PAAR domain-containing protein [Cronobacter sakazakii]ELY5804958.1 PAAR domain-containing protein [Cronobacter sakazakii]MEB8631730.1 PAAR domain-containing protein [Cronobacter sakazakii]PQY11405.1 flagellar biosynthesis protein FlgH [Cronobacter sakazakii]HDU8043024.1 PAAR domain-containing protein [Cronobacter sakazakii]